MGVIGSSFIAFSKILGSSFAPGGRAFLLGLPWGVAYGEVKALLLVGVVGRSRSWPERVCKSGGGIGSLKSCLLEPGESGVLEDIMDVRSLGEEIVDFRHDARWGRRANSVL